MRRVVALIVLGTLAIGTARTLPRFQSDLQVWEAAVAASPSLPRPALNLATAYRKADRHREALIWLLRAAELSHSGPRGAEVRRLVSAQLLWMDAFGAEVCSRPAVRRWCSS